MSVILKIANVETMTAIWEFNPTLLGNRILRDSLDVIAAVHMLTIKVCPITEVPHFYPLTNPKIQCSGQHIEYFQTLQENCGIEAPLSITLHSNVRWGMADRMLGWSYHLRQVSTHAFT